MVQIWDRDAKAGERYLTPIIPVLFYHGQKTGLAHRFSALFPSEIPEPIREYITDFSAEIFDLSTFPDEQIIGLPVLTSALWAMKYARTQIDTVLIAWNHLAETFGKIFPENPHFRDLQTYLFVASDLPPEQIIDKIDRFLQNLYLKEESMSTAEMLVQKGLEQGLEQGLRQSAIETARRMKAMGFEPSVICEVTGLSPEELRNLPE
jgi:predicted transposase YdaD